MARKCASCGKELTPQATFCTFCGADVAPAAMPLPAPAQSARFCRSCGAELASGARFCAACGASTEAGAVAPPSQPEPNRTPLIVAAVAGALLLLGVLFWLNRYEWLGLERPVETGNTSAALGEEAEMYAVATANLRDRPTSQGSEVMGKLPRGTVVKGTLLLGEDGRSNWLKIDESGWFVSAVNLSESEPPALAQRFDKAWYAAGETPILAKPQAGAPVLETASPGRQYRLVGLTSGGFAEVALGKGGVGYFDASGVDLAAASAPPIDIAFDPATCSYGQEVQLLIRKLSQESQRATQLAEARGDTAALDDLEGKSRYLKLARGFAGLSVTGVGIHYEATGVYFADPPDRVIAAFRAKGLAIDSEGDFSGGMFGPSSSIRRSVGEEKTYGQTALICGV